MSTFDVSQLNNLFNQIDSMSGKIGAASIGKSGVSYNDVAWFANAVVTASTEESTPEEKANAIQQMAKKAVNLFEKILTKVGNNEKHVAKKEVEEENKKSQELVEKSKKLEANLNGSLADIQGNIEAQSAILVEAKDLLGKTQKSIEDKQRQIQEIVAEIEAKQKELADATTDEEKAALLAKIQGLAGKIAGIGASIEVDSKDVSNLVEAVDDTVVDIEASTQKLAETQEAGLEELSEQATEAGKIGTDVSKTATTGGFDKVEEKTLQASAELASSNAVTGASIAPKLYMAANDKGQAASTRLQSIAGNISKLAQGIGGLSNATQVIANFENTIGSALNGYSELFGQWDSQVQPVIVSLGSFGAIADATEELTATVESDLSSIGFEVGKDGNAQKMNNGNNPSSQSEEKSKGKTEGKKTNLATPKFDTQKLVKFGL